MRSVFVADSPAQAHLVAGLLEEEGVRCVVEGEMLFGVRGDLGLSPATLPRVCVRDEDAARAAELIGARARRPADERAQADEDALPPPVPWRRAATVAILWTLLGALSIGVVGGLALPIVAVCLFVHVWHVIDRAS